MCGAGVLFFRGPESDRRPKTDEGGSLCFLLSLCNGLIDRLRIVSVPNRNHLPAAGSETLIDVLGKTERRGTGKGDPVVVIKNDELPQAEVTGQRASLCG